MLTDAGSFPLLWSKMNGTKKLPHWLTNVKMVMTTIPGIMSGATMRRSDCTHVAPSTQAACSRSRGTPSMKPFISHIPNGNDVAVMNKMTAGTLSTRLNRANIEYTGTRMAVIGSPVVNTMVYRKGGRKRML